MAKSKRLFQRISIGDPIESIEDTILEKKIDSELNSGSLFIVDDEYSYKNNKEPYFSQWSGKNYNYKNVIRKYNINKINNLNKKIDLTKKSRNISLSDDELDIWGASICSNNKTVKRGYPGEKLISKGPSIILPSSGESLNPSEFERQNKVFQSSACEMRNLQEQNGNIKLSLIDSLISDYYNQEDIIKLTESQKYFLFNLLQKGELIDIHKFEDLEICNYSKEELKNEQITRNKNKRKKRYEINRIERKKRARLQIEKEEITKKLNSDVSNIDTIIGDINNFDKNIECKRIYFSILREQLESARRVGIISKFKMGRNFYVDKPGNVLLKEDFELSNGSLRKLNILNKKPSIDIISSIYRRGLTEIPPRNDSNYGRRLSKLLRRNRKARKVSKKALNFVFTSLLPSGFYKEEYCMHRDTFKKNKPILGTINPSSGFLVLVTGISSTQQHSKYRYNSKSNGNYLAINAKLTDTNRLYKTSILTKSLSDNQQIDLFFTIFCFSEWSNACSFISEGDIIEIIGAFVKIEDDLIIYEYNNSKRDSSMTVWRKGFEHVPAILTHAAVVCSKGNVYLPAWARIYDRSKFSESDFYIDNDMNNGITKNCRIGASDKDLDFHSRNSSIKIKEINIDNTDDSQIEELKKKRKTFSSIDKQFQNNSYTYIEKLSDIKPNINTNLYGVVLEVGNNPIKRSNTHQTHIFINVTLIDPSVVELVPIDSCTRGILENLLSGIYRYNDRPQLNQSIPTISLEIATHGDVNTLPIISLGDIVRVHRVEPAISKRKYIDIPYNFRNTSIRVWSIYDLNLDTLYIDFTNDEDILESGECYFTVENAFRAGNMQQKTTFTKNDSIKLLGLQRWVYELFHEFPYFSLSPYTKSLSFLLDESRSSNCRTYGDVILLINDVCFLPELINESSVSFDLNGNPHIENRKKSFEREQFCLIVTEHVSPSRITLEDIMKFDFDNAYLVLLSGNFNYGLRDYFLNNKKPLSPGDWIRIKNASLLAGSYYSYRDNEIVGPFTVIETNRSRITRLPFWSGDVKLISNRTSPISFKKDLTSPN
ncbi:hypothetical protein FG386_000744 [Cryptosporidium ryanae]|uniref:uncharacterized protein n=1 Tax=Cryptosporidium ryanae TaxID=515981 RepID=UPI00351A9C55|nr:hypothetical protein FG386_000744 [Cryptosporidium ryanae]